MQSGREQRADRKAGAGSPRVAPATPVTVESYAARADELAATVALSSTRTDDLRWPDRARALAEYGDTSRHAGRITESEDAFRTLRAEAEAHGDRVVLSIARLGLGNALCARSRWEDAIAELEPIPPLATSAGDRVLAARARCVLASAHFNRGDLDPAASLLRDALVTAREYEHAPILVPALVSLGVIALARGEVHEAYARISEGLAHADRAGDAHWAAMARSYLAIHAHLCGRAADAEEMYARSVADLDALGLRRALGLCHLARATLWMSLGRWPDARRAIEAAASGLGATCPDYEPAWLAALAICDLAEGDVAGFRHRVEYAESLAGDASRSVRVPLVRRVRALDRSAGARSRAGRARSRVPSLGSIELALIDRACTELERRAVAPTLVIDAGLARFRVPASTDLGDVSRRAPLRRLLALLVARHREHAGATIPESELVASAWPDERIAARAANNRLHNAISTLRRMGLREWIERTHEGYRLRPDLVVRIAKRPDELVSEP